MNGSVVGIVSAFFIIGIVVGIIVVIALPALRTHRSADPGDQGEPPEQDAARPGEPRWPGDADNDFSS